MSHSSYEINNISLADFPCYFDLSINRDQQVGTFNNSTLEMAERAVLAGVVPPMAVVAYHDQKTNKLIAVCQSGMLNHLLALCYPKEMGINVSRTMIDYVPRVGISEPISLSMNSQSRLKIYQQCENAKATTEELENIAMITESFAKYAIPVYIYKNSDLALMAARIN